MIFRIEATTGWPSASLKARLATGRRLDIGTVQLIGEFVRTGPASSAGQEWWVTRSFAISDGLLKDGPIDFTFSEPGITISAVALTSNRVADMEN